MIDMKPLLSLASLGMILICTGCGTIVMRIAGPGEELYPATKGDIIMIHGCLYPDGTIFASKSYVGAGLTVIDIPISLTTDTVLLPIELLRRHDIRKQREDRKRVNDEVDQIVAVIRKSPSVGFDKRWHTSAHHPARGYDCAFHQVD